MRWFRAAALICISTTVLMAVTFTGVIISMCTNSAQTKAMDRDPNYNGTLGTYVIIVIVQICFISSSFLAYYVSFINWRNNYQMDHGIRRKFIMWMFLWSVFSLLDLGVAIYAIVRGKEPQEEMASLYETFSKYNQDVKFVGHFERYQRENSCCGVYGPDDWLMVQLRSGMGGGGGGGGFQSLDYGFRQNPSTGKCHLTPPTIPMGCGRRILEALHIETATYAGLMILQTLIALAAACLAGYSFFYWLEKEVIVIPEDEVSNLIILEPESSTSMVTTGGSNGGYLQQGVGSGYYPGGGGGEYLGGGPSYVGSRGPSYMGSQGGGGSGSRGTYRTATVINTGYYPNSGMQGPGDGGPGGAGSMSLPPGNGTIRGSKIPPGSAAPTAIGVAGVPTAGVPGGASQQPTPNSDQSPTMAMLSQAGPFDAGSRPMQPGSNRFVPISSRNTYIYQAPPGTIPNNAHSMRISRRSMMRSGSGGPPVIAVASKPHSEKHMLHAQERALGGKVLGEMHVDHSKDEENAGNIADTAVGKHGHKAHHATVAIVRNRNAPKPKKFFADNINAGKGHHGQTGHLAEDIAEMTGNQNIIKHKLDDVVLPVEHGGADQIPGGYLKKLTARRKEEALIEEEAMAGRGGTGSVSGIDAQNILSSFLEPVAVAHANNRNVYDEDTPLIQPHTASGAKVPVMGSHQDAKYLNAGSVHENAGSHEAHHLNAGSHENAHYLHAGTHTHHEAGSHENAHYLNPGAHHNAHYLNAGSHQNAHYINGAHQKAHYLNAGSHENAHYIRGSHQNAHYLNSGSRHGSHQNAHYLNSGSRPGSHQNAHYVNRGSHQNAHYINGARQPGQHENAHYITGHHENAHYITGQHKNAHYITGQHENAHYITGQHENAHYINRGSHQNAHYINNDTGHTHNHHNDPGQHDHAHYLNAGSRQPSHHRGSHHRAHYLNNEDRHHGTHEHENTHHAHHGTEATHHHPQIPPVTGPHHAHKSRHDDANFINKIKEIEHERSRSRQTGSAGGPRPILTGFLRGPRPTNDIFNYQMHGSHQRGNEFDRANNKWSVRTVVIYKNPNPFADEDD